MRMPDSKRAWTEENIARLKTMAGKIPAKQIAAELGRTLGATAIEASKLGLSLRLRRAGRRVKTEVEDPSLTQSDQDLTDRGRSSHRESKCSKPSLG